MAQKQALPTPDDVHEDIVEEELSAEEIELGKALMDPVIWCETHLRNPDKPEEFLQFRTYQRDAVRYQPIGTWDEEKGKVVWTRKKKLYRWGRRVGKSVTLMAEVLWLANTLKNYKIIFIAPFEDQIRDCWGTMRQMMQDSIFPTRIVEKPFIMEFANGSWIKGMIGGAKQKQKEGRGSSGRGKGCDCIAVVEMDHGIDHVLRTVVMPFYLGKAHCRWIGDSTPSGARGLFYQWCTTPEKDGGAKEFYLPSSASPEWNESSEREARQTCESESKYQHEYLAEWGEEAEGVFKAENIANCIEDYKYDITDVKPHCTYSMGIDWNQTFGVKIFIVEWNNFQKRYRTFYKHEVPNSQFTQTQAVDIIIDISKKINLSWIYVDKGFGTTQVELLHKYGKDNPSSRLDKIVKAVDFKSFIELRDPATKEKIKKPMKPFCVANAAGVVENEIITLPASEDHKNGLVGQMRGYMQRVTPSDNVIFEAENRDDLLVSWMLALLAFTMEMGEFTRVMSTGVFRHIVDPGKVKERVSTRESELGETFRHNNNMLGRINKANLPVRRFQKIFPGSKEIDLDRRTAPPGMGQKPFFRVQTEKPIRRPFGLPRREMF